MSNNKSSKMFLPGLGIVFGSESEFWLQYYIDSIYQQV